MGLIKWTIVKCTTFKCTEWNFFAVVTQLVINYLKVAKKCLYHCVDLCECLKISVHTQRKCGSG
jgi:hypothetical protein